MSTPTSRALAVRATELLGDGQWRPRETITAQLIKLVPPGPAVREYRRKLNATRARRRVLGQPEAPHLLRERPIEEQVRAGARAIVTEFLSGSKAFEQRGERTDHHSIAGGRAVEIRMVRPHHAAIADFERINLERLAREREAMAVTIRKLKAALVRHGFAEEAERIAPTTPESKVEKEVGS